MQMIVPIMSVYSSAMHYQNLDFDSFKTVVKSY